MPSTTTSRMIPGPRGHFLWGSLPEFQRDRLGFVLDLALQYGDVAKMRIGPTTFIQVSHPDGVQHILQENNRNYSKRLKVFETLRWTLGNGLLTSDGEYWLGQRRLMQPAFHRQHIAGFSELMVSEAQAMLDRWGLSASTGQPTNVSVEMMRLTLAIVTRALFSQRVGDDSGALYQALYTLIEDFTFRFDRPFYPSPRLPTPHNRRFKQAQRTVDQVIYSLIEQRRRWSRDEKDLLALLLAARDEETGLGMSDQQLRDELITLFSAGHETTAVALSWTLYLLSQHPAEEHKLREELAQVLNSRLPSAADLPNLPYTRMVIEETLRLYPPAWITNRKAEGDDNVCGHAIPAGSAIAISPYVVHRLPQYWEHPEVFDPTRFTPERSKDRPRYAYLPFGGGPRQCIGNGFAMVEAQLILATILQRYHLDLAPGSRVKPEPLVTLRPKDALWMTLSTVSGSVRDALG